MTVGYPGTAVRRYQRQPPRKPGQRITCDPCERGDCGECTAFREARLILTDRPTPSAVCVHDCRPLQT